MGGKGATKAAGPRHSVAVPLTVAHYYIVMQRYPWKLDATKFYVRNYTESAEQVNRKIRVRGRG